MLIIGKIIIINILYFFLIFLFSHFFNLIRSEKTIESIELLREACANDKKNPQVFYYKHSLFVYLFCDYFILFVASFSICSCFIYKWFI